MGGEAMLSNGWVDEARESLEYARGHWESLGREDKAAEITDLLDEV